MSPDRPPPGETALDLEPIKAREQGASKGWWYAHSVFHCHTVSHMAAPVTENSARSVCGPLSSAADAQFIANARQDIPALIDEIERLRAALRASGASEKADGS